MEPSQLTEFLKEQISFLQGKLSFIPDFKISLMSGEESVFFENVNDLGAFSNYHPKRTHKLDGLDQFIALGQVNFGPSNSGENSSFETYGAIYLLTANVKLSIEFLEEFKGERLFRSFSFASGRIKHDGVDFSFKEIVMDWENGIRNAGLSFLEATKSTALFVKERCTSF